MGLRDIERKLATKAAFEVKDAELLLVDLDQLIEGFRDLEKRLKDFEKKHKNDIEKNKAYYEKLTQLRKDLGLPEEVGVYEWKQSPSFMDRLTGKGFYDQLGVDILALASKAIKESGGVISIAELILLINKNRPGKVVAPGDIMFALESLQKDGLIQRVRTLDSGVKVVEFVAIELSDDHYKVFSLASRQGYVTVEMILMKTQWPTDRVNRIVESLVQQGLAIKDSSAAEGIKYWFPSLG